jgi:hypothetical protein
VVDLNHSFTYFLSLLKCFFILYNLTTIGLKKGEKTLERKLEKIQIQIRKKEGIEGEDKKNYLGEHLIIFYFQCIKTNEGFCKKKKLIKANSKFKLKNI